MNSYWVRKTSFGPVVIVWEKAQRGAVVHRVLLSDSASPAEEKLRRLFPDAPMAACSDIRTIGAGIRAMLSGAIVDFDLDLVALDECPPFQQAVLRATHAIPRGQVSTYGLLAKQIHHDGAARAVGNSLASNPFPLLIPCHRVIRNDGHLGGYGYGAWMKSALLSQEGAMGNCVIA